MIKTQKGKPGQPGAMLKRKQTVAQRLAEVEKRFAQSQNFQVSRLREFAKSIETIWNNQVELSKSEERLDEQFCVLARMSIRVLNDLMVRTGGDDLINEKVVETYFREWAKFRTRPDFRKFMTEWFLGQNLDSLPPPAIVKEPEVPVALSPEAKEPQEPQEFGGDYGSGKASDVRDQATVQEGQQDDRDGQKNAVPAGQNSDSSVPTERSDIAAVPQVPDGLSSV